MHDQTIEHQPSCEDELNTGLLTVTQAQERILDGVSPVTGSERLPVREALGRVLAEDIVSPIDVPSYTNSAMDGFAVRSEDVAGASLESPVTLAVVGEVAAGHEPDATVEPGTAMRVLTGGIVPSGADAVVKVEDTDAAAGVAELPERVAIRAAVPVGKDIRSAGSDMHQGDHLLDEGTRVTPAVIAVLAAAGVARDTAHPAARLVVGMQPGLVLANVHI